MKTPEYVWIGESYYDGKRTNRTVHLTKDGCKHDIAVLANVRSPTWSKMHDSYGGSEPVEAEYRDTYLVVEREQLFVGEK